ncbi:glycerophosphodiester phosphodiesterase family protein [Isoptericola sp. b441]|uniref:Glycerophosphodiester phosphodiesterase family protein n=1 Tax=Actinotalea lenta TaxID=3064654 RepID=A0ABT9DBH8_9CELL|nr:MULTISPECIES: glycerophosphodiester phosphodiesterase family protein [unclassified Isoptericola]MDO8107886.1 glycerophosphodiester phosphodiesterase family protein [Isoptericola sp. b441]MDO8120445.1 glycerophosphodiester phosphodiesterase family protein [Isoptericola sp. b490]
MTRIVAHRGSSSSWPEHTRAAFRQAIADGADGLECDVRLTAEGVAVCWHDATVDRTSDGSGPVLDHTIDELRGLDVLGGARVPAHLGRAGQQVLTLAELVEMATDAGRPLTLAIELKHPAPYGWRAEDVVLDVLDRAGWVDGRIGDVDVSLMSFHPGSLAHLASRVDGRVLMPLLDLLDPATVGDVPPDVAVDLLAESVAMVDSGAAGGVGPSVAYVRAHPDRVRRWSEAGRVVRAWTVDTADDLDVCRRAGVGEVTTNDPAGLRRLL